MNPSVKHSALSAFFSRCLSFYSSMLPQAQSLSLLIQNRCYLLVKLLLHSFLFLLDPFLQTLLQTGNSFYFYESDSELIEVFISFCFAILGFEIERLLSLCFFWEILSGSQLFAYEFFKG